MVVPPIQRGAVPVAWRGEREERRVVCSRGGEHAHTQREGESGGVSGRAIVAWLGAGFGLVRAFWCVQSPPVALVGNERGREWGSLRPGNCGLAGGGAGGDSPFSGCVGDAGGAWRVSPFGGGVGLVVTISLGSVKGGGVVRGGGLGLGLGVDDWSWWCGVVGVGLVSVVGGVWWWLLGLGVFCFVLFVVFWCVCGWVCLFWGWLVGLWWGCWLCGGFRGCVLLFGGWLVCGWVVVWGFGLVGCWVVVWVVACRLVFRRGCVGSVGGMAWGGVLVARWFVRGWCSCWCSFRLLCSGCVGVGGAWFGLGWCWCMVVGLG